MTFSLRHFLYIETCNHQVLKKRGRIFIRTPRNPKKPIEKQFNFNPLLEICVFYQSIL